MINNFDFIKKNESEIFRSRCSEVNSMIDKVTEKLALIRRAVYQCEAALEKPLIDSKYDNDVSFIKKLIKRCDNLEQKQIFQQTIITISIYKCDFEQICKIIQNKLQKITGGLMRNHSTSLKIYNTLCSKKDLLSNYFNSWEDSDSPCKVRPEVFDF